jgi:hypothetical protein
LILRQIQIFLKLLINFFSEFKVVFVVLM